MTNLEFIDQKIKLYEYIIGSNTMNNNIGNFQKLKEELFYELLIMAKDAIQNLNYRANVFRSTK